MRLLPILVAALLLSFAPGCGSSTHQSAAPMWLHDLASRQARIFSESHPSRIQRVKLTSGLSDAIELWGRFACNQRNCQIGACPRSGPSFRKHPNGTCVIRFRYVKLAVDPRTHRIELATKLRGVKALWAGVGPGGVRPSITTLGVDPFGNGQPVTLQRLTADMADRGFDIPLPDSPLANSQNVGRVWEYETGAAIVYYPSSGVELTYGGTGVDYSGVPADDVQLIDGVRAIVRAADNPESFGFAQVMLPIPSGHLVTLLSKRPVSDLVSVAQTMRINGSQ